MDSLVKLLGVLCCLIAVGAAQAADVEKSFRLPVLTVRDSGEGACRRPLFGYQRRENDRTPLAVSVVEDTPGGAGESLRASMWLATMVAALERMDSLSGARISLELSGHVDGPSAGAGICLAILSSLDNRDFPSDCAATGTIMPDGTIGAVGGVAGKIRAASHAGLRRVLVPAYLRFEKDPLSGVEVDLKRLAAELGIELTPVENVVQAYAALHGDSLPPPSVFDRAALELPEATEEVLKAQYQAHLAAGLVIWNAIPQPEREQINANTFCRPLFVDAQKNAESAFRSGRLMYAAQTMRNWHSALEARINNDKSVTRLRLGDFQEGNVAAALGQLDAILQQTTQLIPNLQTLFATELPPASLGLSQSYADYHDLAGALGVKNYLQHRIDTLLTEMPQGKDKTEERSQAFQALVEFKVVQMFLVQLVLQQTRSWHEEKNTLVASFPGEVIAGDAAAAERLFHSAHLAAHQAFQQDVIHQAAVRWEVSDARAVVTLSDHDDILPIHLAAVLATRDLHERLTTVTDSGNDPFARAVSAHLQAENLGVISGLLARWNDLDVRISDASELRYGRMDLLNYLLIAARTNAWQAITACHRRGIPCHAAIYRFEIGEMTRDDAEVDRVRVLINYWTATLQAKVLLMLSSPVGADGRVDVQEANASTLTTTVSNQPPSGMGDRNSPSPHDTNVQQLHASGKLPQNSNWGRTNPFGGEHGFLFYVFFFLLSCVSLGCRKLYEKFHKKPPQ